ncbi:GSCFA domain-containing protein [Maribellus sp. YY47]|uniref:GSCFA domain-containing protein n=1 Tax=Maribellus sp. YY47 TaxID=2929486 RepID=UPI0020006473|nr:GSCFA domain-containing protein [Maribellus sp. YY47]MCK3684017.1 GSCFA domain-containing protein [Maribellus sp. YY47]
MRGAKFQTYVDLPHYPYKAGYRKKSVFIGSCFTENVGNRMLALKYPVDINPFGILYNPSSVAKALQELLDAKKYGGNELFQHNDIWHSFMHHGRFSSVDQEEVLEQINTRIAYSSHWLREAGFLFLTFGTSWIYRFSETGEVVANCHKVPASKFVRERLSVKEIVDVYTDLLPRLWEQNPGIKIVFTVSPIRHWKDGAIENQRSKAALILAIDELVKRFPEKCYYFPSYEIVMDELRDYRFYAEDMLHLTDVAVDHIWSVFEESLIDGESRKTALKIQKVVNAMHHRPLNKRSQEFAVFLNKFLKMTEELETEYSYLNLKLEKEYFIRHLEELNENGR